MTTDEETLQLVSKANRKLRDLEAKTTDARTDLHKAIRQARRRGYTLQTIADLTGYTAMRISQIARD